MRKISYYSLLIVFGLSISTLPAAYADDRELGLCLYQTSQGIQSTVTTKDYCYKTYNHPPEVVVLGWSPLRGGDGKPIQSPTAVN